MKKVLSIFAFLMAVVTLSAQEITVEITGEAENASMVYLSEITSEEPFQSVEVEDGTFSVKVTMQENSFLDISTDEEISTVVLIDGEPIYVNFNNGSVEGSELNNILASVTGAANEKTGEMFAIYMQLAEMSEQGGNDSQIQQLADQCQQKGEEVSSIYKSALEENIDNVLSVYFLYQLSRDLDAGTIAEIINSDDYDYSDHPLINSIVEYLESDEAQQEGGCSNGGQDFEGDGEMFTDLTIPDMNGNARQLSEWCGQGNVVLIDFWASWCGPCRMEMPNIVENYAKYHEMGFEVIGISFDDNKRQWMNAVNQMGMEWPQLSELKSWNNKAAKVYGIQSIPSNILVDSKGRIIATNVMGPALGETLEQIFGR